MRKVDSSTRLFSPLESALRTSLVFFWVIFVIGVASGWAIAQISRAPIGAIIGFLIGAATVAWFSIVFWRSLGTLANPAVDEVTIEPKGTESKRPGGDIP